MSDDISDAISFLQVYCLHIANDLMLVCTAAKCSMMD